VFWRGNVKENINLEDPDVERKIILEGKKKSKAPVTGLDSLEGE
jgi:hypothetical protein